MGDEKKKIFCAGKWIETDDAMDVASPYTGEIVARVCRAGGKEAEDATAAAAAAFEETKKLPAYRREEILAGIHDRLVERAEELARTICSENGKPISQARVEVSRAATVFKIAAEETKRIGGEYIPMDVAPGSEDRYGIYRRFPLGPVYGITPFNFPLNLACHKVAPALAAGNTIVIKPASSTPLSSLLLAEICDDAGVPPGGISVIPCGTGVAEKLAADERYKLLTFTGSPAVGWALKAKAGRKRVTLELGGNAGVIVDRGADIGHAAERCRAGAFAFAGQVCISLQRIFVHAEIFDDFAGVFVSQVKTIKVGDPAEEDTGLGPMINAAEAQRAVEWVEEARKAGAEVLCGGSADGAMMRPTVLSRTSADMKVNCMEIFAPVVTLEKFDDVSDAIRMVGDSEFGLQAGIFTDSARVIHEAYNELDVGGLMVNEIPTYRLDHMPYGGVKMSGFGREGLKYAIEEMTEGKLLMYSNT